MARIPPPNRARAKASSAPLPAAIRPADPEADPPPAPEVPVLSVLSDAELASTMERQRPDMPPPPLQTMMLSATDLETYLGNGTLALSPSDLETLHTRGLSIADVLSAVQARQQSAEFTPVLRAPSSARRRPRGAVRQAFVRVGDAMRGLFTRAPRAAEVNTLASSASRHGDVRREVVVPVGEVSRAASDDDHNALRQLACDLQAYLDGMAGPHVTLRVLLRDGRVVGVLLER